MFDIGRLTPQQRQAACHSGGNLLIVAGAGTGKTTTLTARLAHILHAGVAPERVLMLTFSRRAAAELLDRAEQLTAGSSRRVWGGTFHSVAHRLLRRHGRALGLELSFTLLDQTDCADLLALIRHDLEGTAGAGSPGRAARRKARKQTLADIHSRCVNSRTPLSEVLAKSFPWCVAERAEIKEVFQAYNARKRSGGMLDYDDLLLCWDALLKLPEVARVLQSQFDHILVDEYQDTNSLQADLLQKMCQSGATITAVGDDAQAIYSFRAAAHRNIMDFPHRFGASVVTLEENHRSTPSILSVTNALAAEALRRHPKALWSKRPDCGRPVLLRCDDEPDQSRQVCDRILDHHQKGTGLREQAILVRAAHHSDLLELELAARRIPFVKYGGLRFLEASHVKDLICLLRVLENERDELAWFRVLQLVEGVGPVSARKLTAAMVAAGHPLRYLREGSGYLDDPVRQAVRELASALADAGRAGPESPAQAMELLRAWLEPRLEARYSNARSRLNDLDVLQLAAARSMTLGQFLADLVLDPPGSTGDLAGPPRLDDDFVIISTIHSAKGCEWDVVHVIHLTDGRIPSDLSTGDAEAIEEERRLLYVAMTRARNHLYAYAPLRYHLRPYARDDRHGYAQLTRFLTPGVLECLDDIASPGRAPEDPAGPGTAPAGCGLEEMDRLVAALWD